MRRPLSRRLGLGVLAGSALLLGELHPRPEPELAPGEAAEVVERNLGLDADTARCLDDALGADPGAATALNTGVRPDDDQRRRFAAIFRRCIPPERFGAVLAASVVDPGDPASPSRECVAEGFVALGTADQDLLALAFANPALSDDPGVRTATERLVAGC